MIEPDRHVLIPNIANSVLQRLKRYTPRSTGIVRTAKQCGRRSRCQAMGGRGRGREAADEDVRAQSPDPEERRGG